MSDNIKVVVKVRPLISREIEDKQGYRWRVKNNSLNQLDQNGRETEICFTFDKVYDKDTQTQEVYDDIAKPIVEAAIAGFNGTIFAYGQTSSGKTYTMSGTEKSPGIIPLSVFNLFEKIKTIPDRDFLVRVSYIEIYNETVKDLLNLEKKNIKIHETVQGVKVDCTEKVTSSPEEVLEAMKEGEVNRQTGATNMNEESSRSHAIFQITIESREHIEGEEDESGCVNVSALNLVDLAGSERAGQTGATGIRFREGTHINKSLSVLGLVIKQLSEDPNKYANYRDSKLTRILQNSLGGNAKTSIVCAVTPASVEETISTLQFANRAKAIKNKPEVNAVATNATMIQSLTKQLSRLQAELVAKRNLEVMLEKKENVEQVLQKQIASLRKLILNGFGKPAGFDMTAGRRKQLAPRRMTISTLHHTEEVAPPPVPKFCTPTLKYNPMSFPTLTAAPTLSAAPLYSTERLPTVPEEVTMKTPPPRKQRGFENEIIEIDSDDSGPETQCSPYHKCYGASKTPPCILRQSAKEAEKNLKEIVKLTEREKLYTPSVVELMEKLEVKNNEITQMKDEITSLHETTKEKDLKIDELTDKVKKSEAEMEAIISAKAHLEDKYKEKDILITDLEVSYETLKKQSKSREQELLNFLAEQQPTSANLKDISKPLKNEKDFHNFMGMSKDISLVNSDNEFSTISHTNEEPSGMQELVTSLNCELAAKNKIIIDLELNINTQKQKIDFLENSSQQLKETINELKNKLSIIETENIFLNGTIETLNTTVENQKANLESANKDIQSYNSTIQELQIKLTNKEVFINSKVDDTMLESLIASEQKVIANNDNLKNIIHIFKKALSDKSKELDALKTEHLVENASLKKEIEIKENQICVLLEEAEKLNNQLNENMTVITKMVEVEKELSNQLSVLQEQNNLLQTHKEECALLIENNNLHKSKNENEILNLKMHNTELSCAVDCMASQNSEMVNKIENQYEIIQNLEKEIKEKHTYTEKIKETLVDKQAIVEKLTMKIDDINKKVQIMEEKLSESQIINDNLTLTVAEQKDNEEKDKIKNLELSQKIEHLNQTVSKLNEDLLEKNRLISAERMKLENENLDCLRQIAEVIPMVDVIVFKLNGENSASSFGTCDNTEPLDILKSKIHCLDNLVTEVLQKTSDLDEQRRILDNKYHSLEEKFAVKEADVEVLTKQIVNMTKKVLIMEEKLSESQIINADLTLTVVEQKDNEEKNKIKNLELSQTIEHLNQTVSKLNEDLLEKNRLISAQRMKLENENQDCLRHIAEVIPMVDVIVFKLNGENSASSFATCDNTKPLDILKSKIHCLDNLVIQVLQKALDLDEQRRILDNKYNSLDEKFALKESDVEVLTKQNFDITKKVQIMEEKLSESQIINDNLTLTLAEQKNNEEKIKIKNLELSQQIEHLNQTVNKLSEDLFEKTRLISVENMTLENENQDCLRPIAEVISMVDVIVFKLNGENCASSIGTANNTQPFDSLKSRIRCLDNLVIEVLQKTSNLDDQRRILENKYHSLEENLQHNLVQLSQHNITAVQLSNELEGMRKDLAGKEEYAMQLSQQIVQLTDELEETREDLARKENRFKEMEIKCCCKDILTLSEKTKILVYKLHNILVKLNGDSEEAPEVSDDLEGILENLDSKLDSLDNLVALIIQVGYDLQLQIKTLADAHGVELGIFHSQIEKLSQRISQQSKELKQHFMKSHDDIEMTSADLNRKNQECIDRKNNLYEAEEYINILKNEITLKDKQITSMQERDKVTSESDVFQRKYIETEVIETNLSVSKAECENVLTERSFQNSTFEKPIEQMLKEAKNEIDDLTGKNLILFNSCEEIHNRNQQLLQEREEINEELESTRALLHELNIELQNKQKEIAIREEKIVMWKEQFLEYEEAVKGEIRGLVASNKKLQSIVSLNSRLPRLSKSTIPSEILKTYVPESLFTTCFNKIAEIMQPTLSESNSLTCTSKCSAELISSQSQTDPVNCDCLKLSLELDRATTENFKLSDEINELSKQIVDLTDLLKELQASNQFLVKEREEVRKEVLMLVEPASELQRKIANHKTNLSTLTATTYAENKLLNSQLRVLNHHHTRYIHVCQRDLPVVKAQLKELLTLLKHCSCHDKENTSFKRYSLPDVLDNDISLSTLKHESTLDGDLLMLDTNISLSTLNNTLVVPDQTCLEITHNFDGESTCQANDITKIADPGLVCSQIETSTNDSQKLVQHINALTLENGKLKDYQNLNTDSQISPLKMNKENQFSESIDEKCQFCNSVNEELQILQGKFSDKCKELQEMKEEKEKMVLRYTNLSLEIPSTEALVKKLNQTEKENNTRSLELNKLTDELNKKKKLLKELQEENDTLSMQVMENISEADELKKELDTLKEKNQKLIMICRNNDLDNNTNISSGINRPECNLKDDLIKSLQEHQQNQPKLNRSFSDSESSSRHKKICTLQNELHASKEDCKTITQEVATIKNHLDRSNISTSQAMDLDESMSDSSIFTITKDLSTAKKPLQTSDCNLEYYRKEKRDCLKFYVEKIGPGKENFETDIQIIDIMKMFYSNLLAKHNNETENLLNKLRDFEDTKTQLQVQLAEANTKIIGLVQEIETSGLDFITVQNVLTKIKENICILNQEMDSVSNSDKNEMRVIYFKENLLKVLDSEFGLSCENIFEKIVDYLVAQHQQDLSEIIGKYTTLQNQMENAVTELNAVKEDLRQNKHQLSVKENEYNLLKSKKEMIYEISNAVTLDIIKKENEITKTLIRCGEQLVEQGLASPFELDDALSLSDKINFFMKIVLKSRQNEANISKTKEELIVEVEALKTTLIEKENSVILLQKEINQKESILQRLETEKEIIVTEMKKLSTILQEKDKNEVNLLEKISEVDQNLQEQKLKNESIANMYDSKVREKDVQIQQLLDEITDLKKTCKEIEMLKEDILRKENVITRLEEEAGSQKNENQIPLPKECSFCPETLEKLEIWKKEYESLVSANALIKEKETYTMELDNTKKIIAKNKLELEKMTSEIMELRESINKNVTIIQTLTSEAKLLAEQNVQLKKQFEEKNEDCSRLEFNIRTHEKTAQIQSKMIKRFQTQKEEDDKALADKDRYIDKLAEKYATLEKESEILKNDLEVAKKDVETLRNKKQSLETKLEELEKEWLDGGRRRQSLDASESARRRRQSLHDSKRGIDDIEDVFKARSSPDDLFGASSVSHSPVPQRRSVRDTSHVDEDNGRSSVNQTRRRRQSMHDQQRLGTITSPPCDDACADIAELRAQLASKEQELGELRERFREVDEECEICAQYLRERDEECLQLRKDKTALEMRLADLTQKQSTSTSAVSVVHAAVNTDEDWANLHSVVVDRMSFDAEVEKNKKLSRTIEELRCKKQELKMTIGKMQRALERSGSQVVARELESVKAELGETRKQLEELQQRYQELDEECDTCAQYLRERDEQCRKLTEAKNALETKLQDLLGESSAGTSARRRRQSAHDHNRSPAPAAALTADAYTQVTDDLLNCQVDRDASTSAQKDSQAQSELQRMKSERYGRGQRHGQSWDLPPVSQGAAHRIRSLNLKLDKIMRDKAVLESQLVAAASMPVPTMYVSTGSAIVQNQQITDVMRENHKLKKINAKLVKICKKRGKAHDSNQENEDPSDLG